MSRYREADEEFPSKPTGRQRKAKEKTTKDAYGFRINVKGQQKQERQECSTSAQAQLPAWSFVVQGRKYPGKGSLKKLVRKGVPPEYRNTVWMEVSGAAAMRAGKPTNYFAKLVASEAKSKSLRQIELVSGRDLHVCPCHSPPRDNFKASTASFAS